MRRWSCSKVIFAFATIVASLNFVDNGAAEPRLGLYSETFAGMSLDEVGEFATSQKLNRLQLASHLLGSERSTSKESSVNEVLRAKGLSAYSLELPSRRDRKGDRELFRMARELNVEFVVTSLDDANDAQWIESLSEEYEVGVAVRIPRLENPSMPDWLETVLERADGRIGLCLDPFVALESGLDPVALMERYQERVFELVLNDGIRVGEGEARSLMQVVPGRGEVDFSGLFRSIAKSGWLGSVVIRGGDSAFTNDPGPYVSQASSFFETRRRFASYGGTLRELNQLIPDRMPRGLSPLGGEEIVSLASALSSEIEELKRRGTSEIRIADAAIFLKFVEWAMRYEAEWSPRDVALAKASLERGLRRAAGLRVDSSPWLRQVGKTLRGHRSEIDGSIQPFGIVLPEDFDEKRSYRLDVVLHGSIRQNGSAMLRFANWFERPHTSVEGDFIAVYPLGRVTNGYRWAGERDVFEVIEAVAREYPIDRERIVLRGFSMGASGTWHIGLKHPDRFAALGPYTGFVDTRRFSEGENPRLIRIGSIPEHQERMFALLDAIGYAPNASMVPIVAAIGEHDVGFRNHQFMADAFAEEGMQMVNLVSQGTKHWVDPVTLDQQMELLGCRMQGMAAHPPRKLSFATYSLRYNRCHWLTITGLDEHYARAEFAAKLADQDRLVVESIRNIGAFEIDRTQLPADVNWVELAEQQFRVDEDQSVLQFRRMGDSWTFSDEIEAISKANMKRPGVQGPIDDAFSAPFLCVRGTGQAWNPKIEQWADATLRRFAYEWNRYMLGDLPIKNDFEVTEEDLRSKNLILFGDPGSNAVMRRALSMLPLSWQRDWLEFDGKVYAASSHVPVMVNPNPLDSSGATYVVLNSGHTFHEADLSTVAYLIYPRLGDWAIIEVSENAEKWLPGAGAFPERVVTAGLFDETWRGVKISASD